MNRMTGAEKPDAAEASIPTLEVSMEGLDQLLTDTACDLVECEAAEMRAREMQIGSIAKAGYSQLAKKDAEQSRLRADHTTAVLSRVFTASETDWGGQIVDRVKDIKRERVLRALESGRDTPWYR
jgi:hypothetical protein